ncbi:squalene monooxygenase [Cavenderia fasciculata]|uniref:Squalene monooxygenase n=1 Tax=Cavenderia fasciculata TaxID=261658 RepID=F4PVH0_CACFS|nr:squalene monooxygenase [Cavenderia fasciculata]EGG19984.1 squalene monooxygenase [Cavenderia fasciculata]|eukprot:XP_004366967.1 squalene monooxygenase [Cavenderia fasciculata]
MDSSTSSSSSSSVSIELKDIYDYDVIIIGAGVVGTSMAFALGNAGKQVLVVERDMSEPDRIVGELMQPGGVKHLQMLGMGDCFQGIDASPAYGYGIFMGADKSTKLTYPKLQSTGENAIGYSFHHGKFINKLREKMSSAPNVTVVEGTVKALIEDDNQVHGVTYVTLDSETGQQVSMDKRAPLTIVCDGCFSNLRRVITPANTPSQTSTFVGLIIRGVNLPYHHHGHVFLVDPTPILMYRIGSNEIRVLVDVPGVCPSNDILRQRFREQTAPQLPETLRTAFLQALETQQLKKMPNSRLHPQESTKPGSIILGDAWNMRHPLTGAGMTVALSDVYHMSQLLGRLSAADLCNPKVMDNIIQQFKSKRQPLASTLNVLAGALYNVFSADYENLRKACMGYLSLGGEFTAGPVKLLSGLCPKPHVLAMHFFAVAFYGLVKNLFPFPTPSKIATSYKMLCQASDIVVPLLRNEKILQKLVALCSLLRLTKK